MDRRWMAGMLVLLMSAGCSAAVDQNNLAKLIRGIQEKYSLRGMYSLALSIKDDDPENLDDVFTQNPVKSVTDKLNAGEVYKGDHLVVAQVKKPDHAEYRLLKDIKLTSIDDGLLILFSFASSCPTTCTNPDNTYNILDYIKNLINSGKWSNRVFVFEKIFRPKDSQGFEEAKLIKAIENLSKSGIDLANIFRCYTPNGQKDFQCSSCSSQGKVAKYCVDYNAK